MDFLEVNAKLSDISYMPCYWRLSEVETLIEQLSDTQYILVSWTFSFNIPSDVHLCLFRAITSSKEKEMIGSRAAKTAMIRHVTSH